MVRPENADQWFLPQLIGDLKASGMELQLGQNFEPTDLRIHFSILGQIHQQVKDLPSGTPISEIKVVEE